VPIKLAPKGDGFVQLGPDTYGAAGWSGYNVTTELYRVAATHNIVQENYIESYLGDIASSFGNAIYATMRTQSSAVNDISTITTIQAYVHGAGTATEATGVYAQVLADSGGTIGTGSGVVAYGYDLSPSNDTSKWYGFYAAYNNGNTYHEGYSFWSADLAGRAVNPYYVWYDSQGVYRIREDNTFDSVGQAIPALYNPQFAKYTPGAANYERIVEQWEAEHGKLSVAELKAAERKQRAAKRR